MTSPSQAVGLLKKHRTLTDKQKLDCLAEHGHGCDVAGAGVEGV